MTTPTLSLPDRRRPLRCAEMKRRLRRSPVPAPSVRRAAAGAARRCATSPPCSAAAAGAALRSAAEAGRCAGPGGSRACPRRSRCRRAAPPEPVAPAAPPMMADPRRAASGGRRADSAAADCGAARDHAAVRAAPMYRISAPPPAPVVPLARSPIRMDTPPRRSRVGVSGLDRLLRMAAARGASTLYLSSHAQPSVRVDGEIQMLEGEPCQDRTTSSRCC